MTNRDFLKQVSTDGLPGAAMVLEGAKPRSVWRRVAVAVVAAAAIGAIVTVGAQVHMNELEKIEAQSGKEPITDITQLEPGKLYTIENHSKMSDDNPRNTEYSYSVYNELPEGTNPRTLPMESHDTFSDEDEWRSICIVCRCFAWKLSEPEEYSYQRPSASEPETFHVCTLCCALCGNPGDKFDVDGKDIPRGLSDNIDRAYLAKRKPVPPKIEGLTIYNDPSQLEQGVVYQVIWERGEFFFYESTPENNEKGTHRFSCGYCGGCDFLIVGPTTNTYVDERGDEYIYENCYDITCVSCGEGTIRLCD